MKTKENKTKSWHQGSIVKKLSLFTFITIPFLMSGCGPTPEQILRGEITLAILGLVVGLGFCWIGIILKKKFEDNRKKIVLYSLGITMLFCLILLGMAFLRVTCLPDLYEWTGGYENMEIFAILSAFSGMDNDSLGVNMGWAFVVFHLTPITSDSGYMIMSYSVTFFSSFLFILLGAFLPRIAFIFPIILQAINITIAISGYCSEIQKST